MRWKREAAMMVLGWATLAGAGVVGAAPPAVTLELTVSDRSLSNGEQLAFEVRFVNGGLGAVQISPPLDGSFEGMRDPRWSLEFLDADGVVASSVLGHGAEGRCGLTNPLTPEDVHRVGAGRTWTLPSADMVWMPKPTVLPSARPGAWQVRLRYEVTDAAPLTPLSLVSNAVPVRITGGDEALWQCRTAQLASRDREVTQGGAVVLPQAGGGFVAVLGAATEDTQRFEVVTLDDRLRRVGEPRDLGLSAASGDFSAVLGPQGLVTARTPKEGDQRRLEIGQWIGQPTDYFVGLATSADRVIVGTGEGNLTLQQVENSRRLGPAVTLKRHPHAGSPLMVGTPEGFLVVWNEEAGQGRAQRLDRDLTLLEPPTDFQVDGSIQSARALPGGAFEIVYADSGYHGDDPTDLMGLYRVGLPGGRPEALSPRDREHARFGGGAWRADGRFARVYEEDKAVWAGPEASPAQRLSRTGRSPEIAAAGERFVVTWHDWRDDQSIACLELGECSGEAYAAVLSVDGQILVPPTRLTTLATAKPLAPYDDWQRFCK